MHELSLCRAVADTALKHANGRPVTSIKLQVGHFRQVVPDTLQFCWDLHIKGTELDGCQLEIDYIPAVARCERCHTRTQLDVPVLVCSNCSSTAVELVSGEEFLIESIEVAADQPPHNDPPPHNADAKPKETV